MVKIFIRIVKRILLFNPDKSFSTIIKATLDLETVYNVAKVKRKQLKRSIESYSNRYQ